MVKRAKRQRAWKYPPYRFSRWNALPVPGSWPRRSRKASTEVLVLESWTTCWRMRCSCMLVARMRPEVRGRLTGDARDH